MSSDPRRLAQGFIFLFLGLLAALLGCGKQGPPLPPLRAVPAPAKDLNIRQQGTRVLFELTYPKTTAGGMALDGISAVEVWETAQPAPREGKPQPLDPRVFASAAKPSLKVTDADLAAATFGDHLIFSMPLPSTTGTEAHFYAVRTFSKSGERSEFSNQVSLVPKTPPSAPDQLTTTPRPDGVMIEWSPVEGALGYAVYRRDAQEKGHGQPVHAAAPTERSWLDTTARFGQSYIYAVTSFNDRDPFIESAITSEREVRYQDRFAPPTPTDLVALAETGRIRLVWKGTDAEDLAGYVVYRRSGDGDFQRITSQPLTAAEYVDTDVKAGTTYSYRVTALDQAGNESAPGGEVRAALP